MEMKKLHSVNLDRLIENLNSRLAKPEGYITKEHFIDNTPKMNPSWYNSINPVITSRGKYPLTQTCYGNSVINTLFCIESDRNLGYIFVETGIIEGDSNYSDVYENITLRIKYPLKLKDGKTIPNCSIQLHTEIPDYGEHFEKRNDRIHTQFHRKLGDLSSILPDKIFI